MNMRHAVPTILLALTGMSLAASGGFGVGVQTACDLGGGNAIVPRLDYLYATDSTSAAAVSLSATANIFTLGADYNYYFSQRTGKGAFLLAGLGVAAATIDLSGSSEGASASTSNHQTVIYPEAGLGYQFTPHLGAELLYKDLNFQNVNLVVGGIPITYSFSGSLQASLVLRF